MGTSAVCEEIETLDLTLDALLARDTFTYVDAESMIRLAGISSRVECLMTRVMGEFATGSEWALDGAKSAVPWSVARCHIPRRSARARCRRATGLRHLPLTEAAFAKGAIGSAQVDELVRARTPATQEAMARDEAMLVGFATDLTFAAFCAALAYWVQHVDPDGADETEQEQKNRRDVYLTRTINGMYLGAMTLDKVSGAIVSAELVRLETQLFDQDWAEAKARLGRDPKLHELVRTSAHRRADAQVEMATRSASTPAGSQRPRPLVTFVVGLPTMAAELCRIQGGPVVTPGSIFEQLEGADFERIVFTPGARIECSERSRFFVGATRRAIEVRDQECTHEYCEEPAERCQIDHINPWSNDGPTTQENGRVHCGFHNRLRNHGPPGSSGHGSEDHGPEPGNSP